MNGPAQRWQVGQATITSVVEEQTDHLPPELFFPAITAEQVKQHDWLHPHFADADGNISLRVQALVVESGGRTVVVDPCVGNGKTRSLPWWHDQQWPFMERFLAAGFDPAAVDMVVHTHLHLDHVGWATQLEDGRWTPTFPRARYVYVQGELERLQAADDPDDRQILADSVEPVLDAGLAELVTSDADLGSGLRLEPTVGHTSSHASLWVTSGDELALITGDVIHHPLQCAEPTVAFLVDEDPELARTTRNKVLSHLAETRSLTVGTHFPTLPTGRVTPDGEVWRFAPADPTTRAP